MVPDSGARASGNRVDHISRITDGTTLHERLRANVTRGLPEHKFFVTGIGERSFWLEGIGRGDRI